MKNDCQVAVIGLGLIGGSFAAALRVVRPHWSVVGFDRNEVMRQRGLADGLVNRIAPSVEEAVQDADVIILATPVRDILDLIGRLDRLTTREAIVMDVGSTKGSIADAMSTLPARLQAIGGHPMTGVLTTGSTQPGARLFEGQRFVLTPTSRTTPTTLDWARRLVADFKADVVVMEASRHDHAVALTSHLPYLISLPLLELFAEQDEVTRSLAAGGFRTRVEAAGAHPLMWRDILLTNREEILQALRAYGGYLATLERDLEDASEEHLLQRLDRASAAAHSVANRD
jgi:prephenate dehydrogenase